MTFVSNGFKFFFLILYFVMLCEIIIGYFIEFMFIYIKENTGSRFTNVAILL